MQGLRSREFLTDSPPESQTLNPKPQTLNPKPQTLNPKPQTLNPFHPLTYPHPLYLKPILSAQPVLPSLSSPPQIEPLQELRVEGLSYRYPGSENGITDISFTLRRGSLTVVTGQIGAGKTTLLRTLLGLLPKQSGSIFWNGVEIHDPANFLLPFHAAYTPQIPQLFSTSLRENLLLGLEGAEISERLPRAIATAVFDQDLATMPDGLGTLIGTRGFRLSGGQKQRAAAARMLLRQPELLVFDDLSSALDVETEQRLWERLFEGRQVFEAAGKRSKIPGLKDKATPNLQYPIPNTQPPIPPSPHPLTYSPTCLIVSHRPAILEKADWVILLEAGKVSFSGTAIELLDQFPSFDLKD